MTDRWRGEMAAMKYLAKVKPGKYKLRNFILYEWYAPYCQGLAQWNNYWEVKIETTSN